MQLLRNINPQYFRQEIAPFCFSSMRLENQASCLKSKKPRARQRPPWPKATRAKITYNIDFH